MVRLPFLNLDIEPTNRCNAKCYFCPRDKTPHQGLMSLEVFDQALHRAVEFSGIAREAYGMEMKVNLCGLGEPLLNRHTPEMVRRIREAGFEASMSSNAALLSEEKGQALIDAGLQGIEINIGDIDEGYEEIYKLPFERTRDRILAFHEQAGDKVAVRIVLVNHHRDQDHLDEMMAFWRGHGINAFLPFEVMNRGGALFVDHMQYSAYPEQAEARRLLDERGVQPFCGVPFLLLFIGYDGQYYLCCSDWTKEAPVGSVFDSSFVDAVGPKIERVTSRAPVCRSCNFDPLNQVTEELRAIALGEADIAGRDKILDTVQANDVINRAAIEALGVRVDDYVQAEPTPEHRLIPVQAN